MKSAQYTAGQVRGTGKATQRGKAPYNKHQAAAHTTCKTAKPCALVSSSSIAPMPCKLTHKEWVALLEGPVMLHILLYSLKEAEKTAMQLKTVEGPWGLSYMETTDNTTSNVNTTSNINTTKAIITNIPNKIAATKTAITKPPTKTATTNIPTKAITTTPTPTKSTSTTTLTKTALPDQLAAAPESYNSHRDSSSQPRVLSSINEQGACCMADARCIITTTMRPSDDTTSATDSTPCEDTTTPPTKATSSPPTSKTTSEEQYYYTACNMQQQQQQPVIRQQQPPYYAFGSWAGRLNESLRSVSRCVSHGFAAWQ